MQRVALEKQEAAINSEMQSTISNTLDNINDMPAEVYNSVNASASKVAAVINKAKEIADSEMDPENKKADLDILWKEYENESFVLNTLTRNIESVNTFGKPDSNTAGPQLFYLEANTVDNEELYINSLRGVNTISLRAMDIAGNMYMPNVPFVVYIHLVPADF